MKIADKSFYVVLALALILVAKVAAAEEGLEGYEILEKMQRMNEQYDELLDKMDSIDERRRRLERLMNDAGEPGPPQSAAQSSGAPRDTGQARPAPVPAPAQRAAPVAEAAPAEPVVPENQPVVAGSRHKEQLEAQEQEMPSLPRVSDDVGGVLTPRGRLTVEPSIGMTYSSVNRIAIEGFTILPALLVGVIDVVEADRDTYTARLTGRYGISNRFEAELTAPYVYRDDSTRSREFLSGAVEDSIFKSQGQGLGDVELGLRYQFRRRTPTSPFVVGNLRIKSDTGSDPFEIAALSTLSGEPQIKSELPTGSGFWSVNPSLTFIYPTDPVVFFGSLGYLWTLEDDKGTSLDDEGNITGFGNVDPGDAYRASFGLGIGLNERSSLSISYALDKFTKTRIETATDRYIAGSDVTIGKLLIGYSLRLPSGRPLNLAVGIGTTEDAPDTDLTLRMPFNVDD